MNLQRGLYHLFNLWFLSDPTFWFEKQVGDITYQFNKSAHLGGGVYGDVYKGEIIDGGSTNIVAFKESKKNNVANICLEYEKDMYELIGDHDQIPKFHQYFSASDGRGTVIVTELLGENLLNLLEKYRKFSVVTIMKIVLQILDVLEYLHKERNIVHNDVHIGNFAVGRDNNSRIYLLDFNVSEQIGDENRCLKEMYPDDYATRKGSPQRDLKRLAQSLVELIEGFQFFNFIDDTTAMIAFLNLAEQTMQSTDQPDYDAFRNILFTELEKHKNEADFDKFDWQKPRSIWRF